MIHGAVVDDVQAHVGEVVTVIVPVPPPAGTDTTTGLTVNVHDALGSETNALTGGPRPAHFDNTEQVDLSFPIMLGMGAGAVVGAGVPGAIIGGLLMANISMYCAYRD